MQFPIYRNYSNNKVFFRVLSNEAFDEITFIGEKSILQHINATTYAEKLYIIDMIEMRENSWVESNEEEFESNSSPTHT